MEKEDLVSKTTEEIVQRLNTARDNALSKWLSARGLDFNSLESKGYKLMVDYGNVVFGVEEWTLYKKEASKSISFDIDINL